MTMRRLALALAALAFALPVCSETLPGAAPFDAALQAPANGAVSTRARTRAARTGAAAPAR